MTSAIRSINQTKLYLTPVRTVNAVILGRKEGLGHRRGITEHTEGSRTSLKLTPVAALRKLPIEDNLLIARLTGKLIQKQPNAIIVDVGGVGYELIVPLSTFYDLGPLGSEVTLRAYTYVREDALQLYGFHTDRERRLFLLLTSVSGIGPRLAITALSGLNAEELILAIQQNNLARLVAIPGVGKKTAERLIVELRDKVSTLVGAFPEDAVSGAAGVETSTMREDLVSALVNLGYQRNAADKAVTTAFAEDTGSTFESALKRALRTLSR